MTKQLRTHGGPHAEGGDIHCDEKDDCQEKHETHHVMGTAGQRVYRCAHKAHVVQWSELTPVGHCERDKHPDEFGQCEHGCKMEVT